MASESLSDRLNTLRMVRARRNLLPFTQYTFPQYKADPAHALIARTLDRVVAGEIKRLAIFAPPQHGKSLLVSVHLPAFWLARRPDEPVMLCSYAASLAEEKSRKARTVVESDLFRELFPKVKTRSDSRSVSYWELDGHRGAFRAAGFEGGITGKSATLGIIDDPLKSWEESQSETIREKIWREYEYSFRTRLSENGAIVLVMTRWQEDDLAGRLLQSESSEWAILRLPALAETQEERDYNNAYLGLPTRVPDPLGRQPGEALCPSRYSREYLEKIRSKNSIAWAGQYQGVPRPSEGSRFKRKWFKIIAEAPKCEKYVRYWDKAGSENKGDYTVGLLMGYLDGTFYIIDVVRGQWSPHERNEIMLATAEQDAAVYGNVVKHWVEQEPGSGGLESALITVRLLAGYSVFIDKVTGSKEIRAEPLASQFEPGNVFLVRASWNQDLIDEYCSFPGKHDDMVDAGSGAIAKLTLAPTAPQGYGVVSEVDLDGYLRGYSTDEVYQVNGHTVTFPDEAEDPLLWAR